MRSSWWSGYLASIVALVIVSSRLDAFLRADYAST